MGLSITEFKIPGFSLRYSNLYLAGELRLNEMQARVYEVLRKGRDALIVAPPGSGKTLTLLLNTEPPVGRRGFSALYPNNTLLRNQSDTLNEILTSENYFNAELVYPGEENRRCEDGDPECIEPLRVYKIDPSVAGGVWGGDKYVALLALSSKSIQDEPGVPKREELHKLAKKVFDYDKDGGIYTVVLSTIDTFLLVSSGAYRDFENVGKTVHNILLALARGEPQKRIEKILMETQTLVRGEVDELVAFVLELLDVPLFIDEFHLYGPYEVDALYALLQLLREFELKKNLPVIFSSATPAKDILEEVGSLVKPENIEANLVPGEKDFPVKGEMSIAVVPVSTTRKGLAAYYEALEELPNVALQDEIVDMYKSLRDGERALIILDRLWMVAEVARELNNMGIEVECIASIFPEDVCRKGARVIVGSEATTQGVNLGNVVLGVMSGVSSEDVIQRVGRVGRRGVNSKVYLVAPSTALESVAGPKETMSYDEFVGWVSKVYPSYYTKRERNVLAKLKGVLSELRRARRELIYFLGVVAVERLSGMNLSQWEKVSMKRGEAVKLLNTIIAPPEMLARLVLFRRSGFNVNYAIGEHGKEDVTSIGLISRNFKIKGVKDNRIIIELSKNRSQIVIGRVSEAPSHIVGRIMDLKTLLKLLKASIRVGAAKIKETDVGEGKLAENVLVYVTNVSKELVDYISYSCEGAKLESREGDYAVIFI